MDVCAGRCQLDRRNLYLVAICLAGSQTISKNRRFKEPVQSQC